jgi:hypothetical protein
MDRVWPDPEETALMSHPRYSTEEILERAQVIYEQRIRPEVEAGNKGKFLIIDIETGDYEMDADDLAASKRAKANHPEGTLFTLRIGYPAAYRLGGRFLVEQS